MAGTMSTLCICMTAFLVVADPQALDVATTVSGWPSRGSVSRSGAGACTQLRLILPATVPGVLGRMGFEVLPRPR